MTYEIIGNRIYTPGNDKTRRLIARMENMGGFSPPSTDALLFAASGDTLAICRSFDANVQARFGGTEKQNAAELKKLWPGLVETYLAARAAIDKAEGR